MGTCSEVQNVNRIEKISATSKNIYSKKKNHNTMIVMSTDSIIPIEKNTRPFVILFQY
jgi:hypothetical protein